MKEPWQKNTVVIVATYTLEFLSELKAQPVPKRPGLMRIVIDKHTPQEKVYQICPGQKTRVPVLVATELERHPNVASVMEIK